MILNTIFGKDLDSIIAPLNKISERLQAFIEKNNAEYQSNASKITDLQNRNTEITDENKQADTVRNNLKNLLAA